VEILAKEDSAKDLKPDPEEESGASNDVSGYQVGLEERDIDTNNCEGLCTPVSKGR